MPVFKKPALSIEEQLALLVERGLQVSDSERACQYLEVISYFRLSAYMRPFQVPSSSKHQFKVGALFSDIVSLYAFDRELRLLVMDSIERVEVAVRTAINNVMSTVYSDPHWYLRDELFKANDQSRARLLEAVHGKIKQEVRQFEHERKRIEAHSSLSHSQKTALIERRKQEHYFRHYGLTYEEPALPPGWAMIEELSLGQLSRLFAGIARDRDKKAICKRFCVYPELLTSWLHTLTFVRNICAHHGRLWNRELAVKPKVPTSSRIKWAELGNSSHEGSGAGYTGRLYIVLLILNYLMQQVSPDSEWNGRLKSLLEKYPKVPIAPIGIPEQWQQDIFWRFSSPSSEV